MGVLANLKLGVAGSEKWITFPVQDISMDMKDILAESANVQGDYYKSIFKVNVPTFSITGARLTIDDFNLFAGLKQRKALLNFKWRDDLAVIDEQNISTDTTHVTLYNTSASGITITGVWLLTDPTHAGTNYYTSGSYNTTTRVVTLGSALPGALTEVLINYAYTGHGVVIKSMSVSAMRGFRKNYLMCSISLEGV